MIECAWKQNLGELLYQLNPDKKKLAKKEKKQKIEKKNIIRSYIGISSIFN